jgi:hypothetical protein
MAQQKMWTSQLVDEVKENLRFGINTDLSCFHERDVELKGYRILFKMSPYEYEEFVKCSGDINYFVEKYCRFLTDAGRDTVKLRKYQNEILNTLGEEHFIPLLDDMGPKVRNFILMASRQTGKTTTIAAYFAWYMCFHSDRNLSILANKQKTTIEIVSKVVDVFKGLPFFLKPGISQIGALGMKLDNGCELISQATTKTASIGYTIHVLYADEFAHIPGGIVKSFWRSVYPTLSSSLISQCIISSTPAGTNNLFYDLWDKAVKGLNSFKFKKVHYWEVPEHDDAWAEEMKKNFGEEEFAQEFELSFTTDSRLLLTARDSSFIKKIEKKYKFDELDKTKLDDELYENLTWDPTFDPNKDFSPEDLFVLTVDTGEGKEASELKDNDYNIINIFKVEPKSLAKLRKLRTDELFIKNMFRFRQVGMYRDNLKDDDICAKVAKALVYDQFGSENSIVVLEMNFNGKNFLNIFSNHDEYYDGIVLNTYHSKPIPGMPAPRKKPGFKMGVDKNDYCKFGKKLIKERTIIINEASTALEFSSFGKDKSGKYKGIAMHDDTVISTINLTRLYEDSSYEDRLYDLHDSLPDSFIKRRITKLLEMLEVSSDIDDSSFDMIYSNSTEPIQTESNLTEMFAKGYQNLNRYNVRDLG